MTEEGVKREWGGQRRRRGGGEAFTGVALMGQTEAGVDSEEVKSGVALMGQTETGVEVLIRTIVESRSSNSW